MSKTTYTVDEDTQNLIEIALNCLVQLSEAQLDEAAAANLITIADALAERFNITRTDLEEQHHGDEIIYKPRGGVFGDDEDVDVDPTLN